ncbi:hypothetical protein GWI33_012987 [Rhynchophorus ferrugineus]|uniref:Uncharacterized protein n=1 Tax=Rhynchophorus ferrugineus TaxID=354439 RepID=A0A834MBY9_RHYFE|nr:hypothetical protein GWI33_012987 [Rhynchophorus ferrugineus]
MLLSRFIVKCLASFSSRPVEIKIYDGIPYRPVNVTIANNITVTTCRVQSTNNGTGFITYLNKQIDLLEYCFYCRFYEVKAEDGADLPTKALHFVWLQKRISSVSRAPRCEILYRGEFKSRFPRITY